MSVFDYMPHRLLINRSLRKKAEELHTRISNYETALLECKASIDAAKNEAEDTEKYCKIKLLQDIHEEQERCQDIAQHFSSYVEVYFKRILLINVLVIKKMQCKIFDEEIDFLSEQKNCLDEDISSLEKTKNEFMARAKVDDIIQLADASGYELDFCIEDNAEILLNKVRNAIDACNKQSIEIFALKKLQTLIKEKSEYISTIKHISWVLEQKKYYKNSLSKKLRINKQKKSACICERNNIHNDLKEYKNELENIALDIYFLFIPHIVELDITINDLYDKKNNIINRKDNISIQINNKELSIQNIDFQKKDMKKKHSHDTERWNQLTEQRQQLISQKKQLISQKNALLDELTSAINLKKNERQQWYDRLKFIKEKCLEHNVKGPIISISKNYNNVKCQFTTRKLDRIKREKEKSLDTKRSQLRIEYEQSLKSKELEIAIKQADLDKDTREYNEAFARLNSKKNNINMMNKNNGFLDKLLNLPTLVVAKCSLQQEEADLNKLKEKKNEKMLSLKYLKKEKDNLERDFQQKLQKCTILSETAEEKKLLFYKQRLENNTPRGNNHGSKNRF